MAKTIVTLEMNEEDAMALRKALEPGGSIISFDYDYSEPISRAMANRDGDPGSWRPLILGGIVEIRILPEA